MLPSEPILIRSFAAGPRARDLMLRVAITVLVLIVALAITR